MRHLRRTESTIVGVAIGGDTNVFKRWRALDNAARGRVVLRACEVLGWLCLAAAVLVLLRATLL